MVLNNREKQKKKQVQEKWAVLIEEKEEEWGKRKVFRSGSMAASWSGAPHRVVKNTASVLQMSIIGWSVNEIAARPRECEEIYRITSGYNCVIHHAMKRRFQPIGWR